MIKIYLKPNKDQSLKRFHPWVFSGAINKITSQANEGDIVEVYSHSGEYLGKGHYALGSIAVRILTFSNEDIDKGFFCRRIESALRLRIAANLIRNEEYKKNNVFRLVHGEGDGLPALIVDIYGDTAVMQAHSMGMHNMRNMIAEAIVDVSRNISNCCEIKAVYYKSEGTLPKIDNLECSDGFILGNTDPQEVFENGIRFMPDWVKGQKTGFFIDQRDNRSLVEQYAKGRTLLNAFCYTGGFSLYALRGGALRVDSLDSSAKAMYLTEEHIKYNFDDDIVGHHKSICQDAFDYLNNMKEDEYDMIILDPPAFAKHRKVLKNALVGYRKINTQAFKKIAKGGILFTFSCSQAVSTQEFRLAVFSSAAAAKRNVRILHQLTQPVDHPINIYHPEGEYLKGLVLQVD